MFSLLKKSLGDVISRPKVTLYFVIMLLFQVIMGFVFLKVNEKMFNAGNALHVIWFSAYSLILLAVISLLTILVIRSLKEKQKNSRGIAGLSLQNIVIVAITIITYNVIFFVANWITYFIGKSIALATNLAQILFFILFFIGLITILLFLSLSSFFLVKEEKGVLSSLKSSTKFVKSNYLLVLSIFVVFFVLLRLSNLLSTAMISVISLTEVLNYIIIYPLLAAALANIINLNSK